MPENLLPVPIQKKWSEPNEKRTKKMIEEWRMTEAGLAKMDASVMKSKPSTPKPKKKGLLIPPQIKKEFMANRKAWENFCALAPGYRRLYVGWIMDARKEETRMRRLREALRFLEQNKKLPMK